MVLDRDINPEDLQERHANAMEYLEKENFDYLPWKEGVRELYYKFSTKVELSQYEPYEYNETTNRQFVVANVRTPRKLGTRRLPSV